MTQTPLFLESVYDALRAIVDHCGGPKTVGHLLFPAKSHDDARKLLLDCLNPGRPEKLDPDQVIQLLRIGRDADFHAGKHWLDAETGYTQSEPIDPDDQVAELARVIGTAGDQLRRATEALERLRKGSRK